MSGRAWERTLAHHRIEAEGSALDAEDSTLNDDAEDSVARRELRAAEKMYPTIVDDPGYGSPHHWWSPHIVHAPESARYQPSDTMELQPADTYGRSSTNRSSTSASIQSMNLMPPSQSPPRSRHHFQHHQVRIIRLTHLLQCDLLNI
jgi:hypothetical protein